MRLQPAEFKIAKKCPNPILVQRKGVGNFFEFIRLNSNFAARNPLAAIWTVS